MLTVFTGRNGSREAIIIHLRSIFLKAFSKSIKKSLFTQVIIRVPVERVGCSGQGRVDMCGGDLELVSVGGGRWVFRGRNWNTGWVCMDSGAAAG